MRRQAVVQRLGSRCAARSLTPGALGAAAQAHQQEEEAGFTGSSASTNFYYCIAADREPRCIRTVRRHAAVLRLCCLRSCGLYCALVLVLGT
jgi:hypothetical protein